MSLTEEQVYRINGMLLELGLVLDCIHTLWQEHGYCWELSNAVLSTTNTRTYLETLRDRERPERTYELTGYKQISIAQQRVQAKTLEKAKERLKELYVDPVVITAARRVKGE